MYDLYFTLPLYPKVLEQRIQAWHSLEQVIKSGHWPLDPIRLKQWCQLAQWRIDQGKCLPLQKGQEEVLERIVVALDERVTLPFPRQEKAALFLLSLNEEQFLNPLRQKEFIQQFSLEPGDHYLIKNSEDRIILFFETLIALMNQFFQLFLNQTKGTFTEGQIKEDLFFDQLMKNYYESKARFDRSLVLTFQLTGCLALQEWIKQRVRHHFQINGYYVLNELRATPFNRQVVITNGRRLQESAKVVCLSTIPEERDIEQTLKGIEW